MIILLRTILVLGLVAGRAAAMELKSQLIRDDNRRFHVEAHGRVQAPLSVVLQTVRDYDHLTEFIPMLVVSHRTSANGEPVIEQVGRMKVLFFHFQARVLLKEDFDPAAHTLRLKAAGGDFNRFDSDWRFESTGKETSFHLKSAAMLKRWVPNWIARRQMKKSVDDSLKALMTEMEHRAKKKAAGQKNLAAHRPNKIASY